MKSTKSKIIIAMCAVLCIMAVGYAAFSTVLTITGTANIASEWKVVFTDITQVSKTDGVTIKSTPVASGTTATFNIGLTSPGDKIVYKITVENKGTIDAIIENIKATETGNEAIIFSISNIKIGDILEGKETTTFNVSIEYNSSITSQPENLTNSLTISIDYIQYVGQTITPSEPEIEVVQPLYLSNKILSDNTAYADNVASKYVSASTGINFSAISSDTNGKGLYYTNTNTENNLTTYYFRGAVDNNYVQFGNRAGCGYKGQAIFHIIDLNNSNVTVEPTEEQCLSTNVCDAGTLLKEEVGMDYRYVTGVDAATCAYLGGTYLTEKATYGNNAIDRLWRIVRINEDGSVRMITQDHIGVEIFNDTGDNAYIGYMYGTPGSDTYEATHANINDSKIKSYIDDWYEANLKTNYSSYLADAGFCNDRSIAPSAGLWHTNDTALGYGTNMTYYGAYNRLLDEVDYITVKENAQPQFACPNASNDLFTTNTAAKGNKALTYSIGLLTVDEAAYAGAVYGVNNTSMYLTNGERWTTISPEKFYKDEYNSYARVFVVNSSGGMATDTVAWLDWIGFPRPVISLKATVELSTELPEGCTKQNGTASCPYIIKTN